MCACVGWSWSSEVLVRNQRLPGTGPSPEPWGLPWSGDGTGLLLGIGCAKFSPEACAVTGYLPSMGASQPQGQAGPLYSC